MKLNGNSNTILVDNIVVGVEEVKTDCDANKLTVKGTNVYPRAIREKLEEIIKKKVELVSP